MEESEMKWQAILYLLQVTNAMVSGCDGTVSAKLSRAEFAARSTDRANELSEAEEKSAALRNGIIQSMEWLKKVIELHSEQLRRSKLAVPTQAELESLIVATRELPTIH